MNRTTAPESDVYPTHFLAALDRIMDALTGDAAAHAEERVMAALHAHARGNSGPLLDAAAEYPLLREAIAVAA